MSLTVITLRFIPAFIGFLLNMPIAAAQKSLFPTIGEFF